MRCDILLCRSKVLGADTNREIWRSHTPLPSAFPDNEEDRVAVREQLERILASPCFRNSRKYPAFLRYVVEHTLDGQTEHLKERTLGVEVFGRPPEYDTSADPVVRIVAAEVRKRIGQYYHEFAAPGEVMLDLHSGTYIPCFAIPERAGSVDTPAVVEPVSPPEVDLALPSPLVGRSRFRLARRVWYTGAALVLGLSIGSTILLTRPRTAAMDQFWKPILDPPGAVLLVTGGGASWMPESSDIPPGSVPSVSSVSIDDQQARDEMSVADVSALADVAGILRASRKSYLIRPFAVMDLPQLRTESAVLIGALNNPWTLRLTDSLRFHFMRDLATKKNWIQDRKNPGMGEWNVVTSMPYASVTDDWAVISRFKDPVTEHWIATAAGLSRWGTIAAGEFLTNPIYLKELARRAPANWASKNLQVVIGTKVMNGQPGPPRILATEFW